MRELSKYRKRPHWSFSSLNLFLTMCTLQWYFRYVEKVVLNQMPVNLVFGNAFHRAAEYLAESRMHGKPAPVAEVQECFADRWSDACTKETIRFKDDERNELAAKGQEMMACLAENWSEEEEVLAISKAFCVPILDANGDQVSEKPLIGELDLVVKVDGKETVVDWKTAARKWPEKKAESDLQATAFLYGYNMSGGASSSMRYDIVTKTKTPGFQQCPTTRTLEDTRRLAELVRVVEKAVAAEAFWPNHTCFACGGCQYSSSCQAWHRDQAKTISSPIQPTLNLEVA